MSSVVSFGTGLSGRHFLPLYWVSSEPGPHVSRLHWFHGVQSLTAPIICFREPVQFCPFWDGLGFEQVLVLSLAPLVIEESAHSDHSDNPPSVSMKARVMLTPVKQRTCITSILISVVVSLQVTMTDGTDCMLSYRQRLVRVLVLPDASEPHVLNMSQLDQSDHWLIGSKISVAGPSQFWPFSVGFGLLQVLCLFLAPEELSILQGDQSLQLPSTSNWMFGPWCCSVVWNQSFTYLFPEEDHCTWLWHLHCEVPGMSCFWFVYCCQMEPHSQKINRMPIQTMDPIFQILVISFRTGLFLLIIHYLVDK